MPVKTKPPVHKTPLAIKQAADLLKMVSDATRLRVITILAADPKNVSELCAALNNSQPAVSHHLALLKYAGLIVPERLGKTNVYSLTDKGRTLHDGIASIVA